MCSIPLPEIQEAQLTGLLRFARAKFGAVNVDRLLREIPDPATQIICLETALAVVEDEKSVKPN